jgi:Pentapeptide repeats (8 copies)
LVAAKLQGAYLGDAKLQGADLVDAKLQGAYLRAAKLQGANLIRVELQGADLTWVEIWLASFPDGLGEQSPAPIGLPYLRPSALTADGRAILKIQLKGSVGDGQLLERLMKDLDAILRDDAPNWADGDRWSSYIREAKEPLPDALAQYLAAMVCSDSGIAENLARRAMALMMLLMKAKAITPSHSHKRFSNQVVKVRRD